MEAVVLLNADYTPLSLVRLRRAILLLLKKKAVMVEARNSCKKFENYNGTCSIEVPKVIRLVEYVRQLGRKVVVWNKKNVLLRDEHTCGYCGQRVNVLTIDHIIPKSRGGKDSFENTVAACFDCNNRKGDKTLDEVGMGLLIKPKHPSFIELSIKRMKQLGVTIEDIFR